MSENKIKKPALEVRVDEKEPSVIVTQSKVDFKALMDQYAIKNPVKFAQKKAKLEAKLASL